MYSSVATGIVPPDLILSSERVLILLAVFCSVKTQSFPPKYFFVKVFERFKFEAEVMCICVLELKIQCLGSYLEIWNKTSPKV